MILLTRLLCFLLSIGMFCLMFWAVASAPGWAVLPAIITCMVSACLGLMIAFTPTVEEPID
jgi:hypothetical protein